MGTTVGGKTCFPETREAFIAVRSFKRPVNTNYNTGAINMKKVLIPLILITAVLVSAGHSPVDAATNWYRNRPVSVELTISSSGAGGSQFTLKGLQTPATPDYVCTKSSVVSSAAGNGSSVKFALIDTDSVDRVKITVKGTAVDNISVTDDSYIDQAGKARSGRIYIRTIR